MSDSAGQRAFQNARLKKKQKAETAKLLERAVALLNTGELGDARVLLRQLLQLAPGHFDGLYLLGMAEYHLRSYHEAELFLAKAADADPRSADAHFNRGVVLTSLGRSEEARASYQRTVALKPQHASALYNLAFVCGILNLQDEALANYDKTLAVKKDFIDAWYNRGLILEQLKRYQEAIDSHDRALALRPRYPEALSGRGSALHGLGRSAEALESYDHALAIKPDFAQAHNNRGIALSALGRNEDALESYDKAVAANPKFADAYSNRGNVQRSLGRHADALDSYDKALAINPNYYEALNGRGAVLTHLRNYEEAMSCFARALAIRPDYAEAHTNRGCTWVALKQMNRAVEDFDRALAINPNMIQAWLLRGHALLAMKRTAEAIESGERARAIESDSTNAYVLLGLGFAALGDVDGAIATFDKALAIMPGSTEAITAKIFVLDFSDTADFEQHRDVRKLWWEYIGSHLTNPQRPYLNSPDPQRRIRVGYVSSDFCLHSAAMVFKPVLQYIDRAQFETVCYSCSPVIDAVTEQFKQLAERWRDAAQWNDARLATQIREDQIDILVDLSGHTAGHRLNVFAAKPAPVAVHGWGHCTPPGLPTIDYVFADPVTIPQEVRHLYLEEIYDLPCMLTLDALPEGVARKPLSALTNGFVTFGVFNRISKISDSAAEAWAKILDRVPRAKLLIKDSALEDVIVRDGLLARLARYGVAADRVELRGATSRLDHLAAFNDVDICLDPFPQNGGASTWEALRMSVPVVAKLGDALSKRAAGGILSAVGLTDWVADSTEGYIDTAVTWAGRIDDLAQLRRHLPQRLDASSAGNPRLYADAVGKAYRTMWQSYCARHGEQDPQ